MNNDKGYIKLNQQARLNDLLTAFATDQSAVVSDVYALFRQDYLSFARKMTTNEDIILDSFQDAVIALYENLVNNKIRHDEASVKTYLFAIGKNKLLTQLRKHKKLEMNEVDLGQPTELPTELLDQLEDAFVQLGDKCREILSRFYYHRYSIEAIMHDMGYKNENTVKAHKSRCMSKLRTVFKK